MGSTRAPISVRSFLLRPTALPLALALYLMMVLSVQGMGQVGEVAAGWTWGPPPRVAVDLAGGVPRWSDPALSPHGGDRLGPALCSQTRPLERLQLGSWWVPLAINAYTGGVADWPARAVHALTGSVYAVVALHCLLGAALLVVVRRFVRQFGWSDAPGVAVLVLATDWTFVFYRRVLGGTELLLLGAGLALLWGLWKRRWRPGSRDGLLIALALGLGLQAKVTFAATAAAFLLALLFTRWDRPRAVAKPPLRPVRMVAVLVATTSPLWFALLHRLALPTAPRIWSHDGLAMQWSRISHGLQGLVAGGAEPAREMPASLAYFLLEPLQWFGGALGAQPPGWGAAAPRILGLAIVVVGIVWAWEGRPWREASRDPAEALLRFLSVAAPLQVVFLWLANRDLHHLAQAAPTVALLVGLACERIAMRLAPPKSAPRALWALMLALPLVVAGAWSCIRTLQTMRTVPAMAVTADGQRALTKLLHAQGVERLWTSDYDLYGVFELLAPQLELSHAWGAASVARDRAALLEDLLLAARGGHYLVVRPSAPRIYDLTPSSEQLARAASAAGVEIELVGEADDAAGGWARLYSIEQP